jgi:predicted enzyme related to lactoylglutathione lyase
MSGANATPLAVDKSGVYLVVSDLARAERFYRDLFGKAPMFCTDRVAVFDVASNPFVLFARWASDIPRTRGNTCVPYLRVVDIEATFARVTEAGIRTLDAAVVTEGPVRLFRIADPDDNLVEFYSVSAK